MKPFLCVYGHTNLDYIMSLRSFPELNTSVNIKEKRRYFGGTGANVATIAASLGVPTALCSYIGPDFPKEFRSLMEERGIDLRDLVTVDDQETATVWIISDEDHNQIAYVYQGPMAKMESMPLRLDAARESEKVHVMTGRPPYYLNVMKECRRLGKKIGFDPAQEIHNVWNASLFKEALSMSEMFFANENELRTALHYSERKRAEELLELVPIVVNTLGAKGSVIYTRSGTIEIPAAKAGAIVDTTGAGDAFRAGFYAGLFRRRELRECAKLGAATASFVIEERGSLTNIPSWDRVEERASEIG
jgi:sugar/nucleoside kinase (ribokinase family)